MKYVKKTDTSLCWWGKRQCINVSTSLIINLNFLKISLDKLINEINQIFLKEYKC